jgi:hypothetical protein
MSFENPSNSIEKIKISEDVRVQLENLGLKVNQINGKILDIGANDGKLGRELKDITGARIVSIDNVKDENTPDDIIIADAKELPFEDEEFDTAISHASIPNVFIGMYSEDFPELSKEEIKKAILKTFREMLRVINPGSSAIMAPVRIADNYNSEKALASALEEAVDEIKDVASVSFELIREVENLQNQERHKEYRLTLTKK